MQTERKLPHSILAERAVIGASLIDETVWAEAKERLTSRDFYDEGHALIWDTMQRLELRGDRVSIFSAAAELEASGELCKVGSRPYLARLTREAPGMAVAKDCIGIVRKKASLRKIIETSFAVIKQAYEEDFDKTDEKLLAEMADLIEMSKYVPFGMGGK